MNVAEVEALGATLRESADQLTKLASVLDRLVGRAPWQGLEATRFKNQWWPQHRNRLGQLTVDLRGFAQSAMNNASEQRRASEAGASVADRGVSGAGATTTSVVLQDLLRLPQGEQVALWRSLTRQDQAALLRGHEADLGEFGLLAPEIRYAANRQLIYQNYMALNEVQGMFGELPEGLQKRMDLYGRLLRDHEQVLFFDPSGDGRIAVVQGDLANAAHVAVTVPGISSNMENYWGLLDEGKRLKGAAGGDAAVVTWLGYDAPVGVGLNPIRMAAEISNKTLAQPAAEALASFVKEVNVTTSGAATVTVIAHSYGSLVAGLAAQQGLEANSLVFLGSPGVATSSATEFRLRGGDEARVYAAEPSAALRIGSIAIGGDAVSNIGHNLGVFGGVPTEAGFGAEVIDIGDRIDVIGSHSDYYKDGSVSLRKLGSIVRGEGPL